MEINLCPSLVAWVNNDNIAEIYLDSLTMTLSLEDICRIGTLLTSILSPNIFHGEGVL